MKMVSAYILVAILSGSAAFGEVITPKPYIIGALGDSISAGFNSFRIGDNRDLSWAVGLDAKSQVNSHAKRLRTILHQPIEIHNEAFAGATSIDLERETDRLLRYKPDYVTFLMGANDICEWNENYSEELALYKHRINSSISRIVSANPQVRIVMLSIPNLMSVRSVGLANGCQATWNAFGSCRPLLDASNTPQQIKEFGSRFYNMNQIIADVAADFPANAIYRPEIASHAFPRNYLSPIDCFHPSVLGQDMMAALSFDPNWN